MHKCRRKEEKEKPLDAGQEFDSAFRAFWKLSRHDKLNVVAFHDLSHDVVEAVIGFAVRSRH